MAPRPRVYVKTVACKLTLQNYLLIRWLAYDQGVTIAEIVAKYVAEGMSKEDFTRYIPPARPGEELTNEPYRSRTRRRSRKPVPERGPDQRANRPDLAQPSGEDREVDVRSA